MSETEQIQKQILLYGIMGQVNDTRSVTAVLGTIEKRIVFLEALHLDFQEKKYDMRRFSQKTKIKHLKELLNDLKEIYSLELKQEKNILVK